MGGTIDKTLLVLQSLLQITEVNDYFHSFFSAISVIIILRVD
jgi:hypothetical protein